jgi:hypothetical protein
MRTMMLTARVMCVLGILLIPSLGRAVLSVGCPMSSSATAYVGYDPNDQKQWVAWRQDNTGQCRWTKIGDSTTLFEDVKLHGNCPGTTHMTVVSSGSMPFCSSTLQPLRYGGYWFDIYGGGDTDVITSAGTGDTDINGLDGDDSILSFRGSAVLTGEDDDDTLYAYGSATGGAFTTGMGRDCMVVSSPSPVTVSCGEGTDRWQGGGTRPSDCEFTQCCGIC